MILPDAAWRQREGLDRLFAALGAGEGDTQLVGGVVRDTLIGLAVSDIDLATRLAPAESLARITNAGFKAVPTGIAHGTVTAVLPDGPVEVTTLRRDIATDGRHATVAFTDDWRADAARRDFTINALFADPLSGEVSDYFGGLADLDAGLVRFIGAPLERIAEDHLRILRFFRFHARFGRGMPDPTALAACAARANDLQTLSRERIAQELLRLLGGANPGPTIALMLTHAILVPVLPEIDADGHARLVALGALEQSVAIDPDPLRNLIALLPRDAAVADAIAVRLKLSKAQRKRIAGAQSPLACDPAELRRAVYSDGRTIAIDRLLLSGCAAPIVQAACATIDGWEPPRLPIGGGQLIALGIPPGPRVAATLVAIERRWIAEGFPDAARVEALAREEAALIRP